MFCKNQYLIIKIKNLKSIHFKQKRARFIHYVFHSTTKEIKSICTFFLVQLAAKNISELAFLVIYMRVKNKVHIVYIKKKSNEKINKN